MKGDEVWSECKLQVVVGIGNVKIWWEIDVRTRNNSDDGNTDIQKLTV